MQHCILHHVCFMSAIVLLLRNQAKDSGFRIGNATHEWLQNHPPPACNHHYHPTCFPHSYHQYHHSFFRSEVSLSNHFLPILITQTTLITNISQYPLLPSLNAHHEYYQHPYHHHISPPPPHYHYSPLLFQHCHLHLSQLHTIILFCI